MSSPPAISSSTGRRRPPTASSSPPCKTAIAGRPIIAAASTHAGEETAIIDAHRRLRANFPGLLTLIVPRHPERGAGVAEIARAAGLKVRLRSRGELPDATTDIYVADTVGELGLIYRLAPIVFVGGSLVKHGGQNPIEPAQVSAPPSCTARMSGISPKSTPRSMRRMAPSRSPTPASSPPGSPP